MLIAVAEKFCQLDLSRKFFVSQEMFMCKGHFTETKETTFFSQL